MDFIKPPPLPIFLPPPPLPILAAPVLPPPPLPNLADPIEQLTLPPADIDTQEYPEIDPVVLRRGLPRSDRFPMSRNPWEPGVYEVNFGPRDNWLAAYWNGHAWPGIHAGFAISWRGLAEPFQL